MANVRCEQGHFYDDSRHVSCPHCGVPGLAQNMPPSTVAHRIDTPAPQGGPTEPMSAGTVDRSSPRAATGGATMRISQVRAGFDPVVGWLVCIEGPMKGRDFRLHGERNFIGRDASMDVCVEGDQTISREHHASVSYSTRNHTFILAPGTGRNLVYLNDADVLAPVNLNAYDVIELGQTKLLLVPLCGENFRWEGTPSA